MTKKKMKNIKKIIVSKKVIELKDWDKSFTYKSMHSDEIIETSYSAILYINNKRIGRISVSSPNKPYAVKRFLGEAQKDDPKLNLWGNAGEK